MSDLSGFGFVMPHWAYWGWLAIMPLLMLVLLRVERSYTGEAEHELASSEADDHVPSKYDSTPLTRILDWTSEKSGLFIAFWTINAVVFYFFEVIMRYIFNQPTIWVHEASYLILGMQYLLAGAYAMLHGAHVRVDIVYNLLPPRGRVGMDIFTSIFFFIFALALASTAWTFFSQSYQMGERTVETWGIQFYPVKGAMFMGAILLLLAGISKLIKDIRLYQRMGRPDWVSAETTSEGASS